MAKMSKAQRTAILSRNEAAANRGIFIAPTDPTADVLVRNGWAFFGVPGRETQRGRRGSLYVTFAGLIAAGVDMDAIHRDALIENGLRICDAMDAEMEQAHADAIAEDFARREDAAAAWFGTPSFELFNGAIVKAGSRRGALDLLRDEALAENFRRRVALARQQPETLRGTLGGVEMGLAVLAQLIESDHGAALSEYAATHPEPAAIRWEATVARPPVGEWTPGAGWERLKREMPHLIPAEISADDYRKADEIIAAANRLTVNAAPRTVVDMTQTEDTDKTVGIADLTRLLGLPDHEQSAVGSWTGDPWGTKYTAAEALDLIAAWHADRSGKEEV